MVNRNYGWNRNTRIVGADTTGWKADDYALAYWFVAQAFVVRKYRHLQGRVNGGTVEDLQGVAIETLLKFARNDYFRVRDQMNADTTDGSLFWSLAKRQINWAVARYLERHTNQDQTIEDTDEIPSLSWMRTQVNRHTDLSTLHNQMVDHVITLPPFEQTLLALYFYEERSRDQIAKLIGMHQASINDHMVRTCARILHTGLSLTDTLQPLKPLIQTKWQTAQFDWWTQQNYGSDVTTYLKYVAINYRADVRYLIDMINNGNGISIRHTEGPTPQAANSKLTPEQVREIRTRLNAGDATLTIANDFDVSRSLISHIKTGRAHRNTESEAAA